jgi:PTHB1 C-terminus
LTTPLLLLFSVRMQFDVTVASVDVNGEQHCSCHTVTLPLALFVKAVPPVRTNAVKLTLAMPDKPPAMSDLFQDIAQSSPPEATSVHNSATCWTCLYQAFTVCESLFMAI